MAGHGGHGSNGRPAHLVDPNSLKDHDAFGCGQPCKKRTQLWNEHTAKHPKAKPNEIIDALSNNPMFQYKERPPFPAYIHQPPSQPVVPTHDHAIASSSTLPPVPQSPHISAGLDTPSLVSNTDSANPSYDPVYAGSLDTHEGQSAEETSYGNIDAYTDATSTVSGEANTHEDQSPGALAEPSGYGYYDNHGPHVPYTLRPEAGVHTQGAQFTPIYEPATHSLPQYAGYYNTFQGETDHSFFTHDPAIGAGLSGAQDAAANLPLIGQSSFPANEAVGAWEGDFSWLADLLGGGNNAPDAPGGSVGY
jgi:hypothetical protein